MGDLAGHCAPNPTPNFLLGQVITCTMTGTAQGNFATLGQYTNTAVVTGTY